MKTDSLFYLLFQTAPAIFFELIGQSAIASAGYRFSSMELKQTAFPIDGVFWPPPRQDDPPVYSVEVLKRLQEQLGSEPQLWAPELVADLQALALSQLNGLAEAMLGWTEMAEVSAWLETESRGETTVQSGEV